MNKRSVRSIDCQGKKVLVRVDFNVPIQDGRVTDETRILESLPTLRYLLDQKASVLLCAHLGRPKGTANLKYSLEPIAQCLQKHLKQTVFFAKDCVGAEAKEAAAKLQGSQVLLLENLRFHPEEEKNDSSFAHELASLAQIFVQDAFGAVHRGHASTVGVPNRIPSASGFLLEKEIQALSKILRQPETPFLTILGGAKVSDKIDVIQNLLSKSDHILIG
ncbi:MAG: phosphoglycerate kinase, partial [Elusimicrobia bacterium]|nr:phosphoglycerate kinase [Elusimicrobiota bacterium]